MSHRTDNVYRWVGQAEAIKLVLDAEDALEDMDLPEWFVPETLERIHKAVAARRADGLALDVKSQTEVNGLVSAAMGDNDHLEQAHRELAAYTVGLAQTSEAALTWVQDMLEQHVYSNVGA